MLLVYNNDNIKQGGGGGLKAFVELIERGLLQGLQIESLDPREPVVVHDLNPPWEIIGTGNYAAVLLHPQFSKYVVKIYAPGREGLSKEAEVYRKLGRHPAYSECCYVGGCYLILKRIKGITFYDCIKKGIHIPAQAIVDIDLALQYARERGLNPHDVHAKNVMLSSGRGQVVDVSDFLKEEPCTMWDDFKEAYDKLYVPFMYRKPFPVPRPVLEVIRKLYRLFRKRDT
jgi:hypothetical protein